MHAAVCPTHMPVHTVTQIHRLETLFIAPLNIQPSSTRTSLFLILLSFLSACKNTKKCKQHVRDATKLTKDEDSSKELLLANHRMCESAISFQHITITALGYTNVTAREDGGEPTKS